MNFKIKHFFTLLLICFAFGNSLEAQDSLSVMFYNVENLFDTEDDSTKNDNEFLPLSSKRWNKRKWRKKTLKISQVITAANYPDIIGLCEIENKTVLNKLVQSNLLWKQRYQIIHIESGDQRGIDVAFLYKKSSLNLLSFKATKVNLIGKRNTRDILSASFIYNTDTVAFFVNHWPSRYGGKTKSIPKRIKASHQLKILLDSISANHPNRKIIAMGDFNDEPSDSSFCNFKNYHIPLKNCEGTIKYRGNWQKFDQFILNNRTALKAYVLKYDFLLEKDKKYDGLKPCRTYYGPRYNGGFSDHLPILLKQAL